jgi:hypothetical protein
MKKLLLLFAILPFMISCNGQEKIDLSKSTLNEPIEKIISYNDKLFIGIETVEYPFSLLVENDESKNKKNLLLFFWSFRNDASDVFFHSL